MKTKITSLLLVLMLAATAFAAQQGRGPKHFNRHQPHMFGIEMLADELKLTEQQLAQIKEQRFAHEKSAIQTRSKIQLAELELRNLLDAAKVDESLVKSKIEEIGKLRTEMRFARVQAKLNVEKMLTPEQKTQLKTIHKERMQKRQQDGQPFLRERMFRHFQGNNGDVGPEEFESELDQPFGDGMEL
jgi:Spy/CpxP family protein refolding chaperone